MSTPSVNPGPVSIEVLRAAAREPRKKRRRGLVGLVPARTPSIARVGEDLVFPSDGRDTNIVNHGGQLASGVAVQFLFWGSFWQGPSGAGLAQGFLAKCRTLFAGPYFVALTQYGVTERPSIRGASIVLDPSPARKFDQDDEADYWSKGANACVVRQAYDSEVQAVARTVDHLDLFVVGNDGVVYTSAWSTRHDGDGVNNDWRPLGGFFPVGV